MLEITDEQMETLARLCKEHGVVKLDLFGSATRDDFDPATSAFVAPWINQEGDSMQHSPYVAQLTGAPSASEWVNAPVILTLTGRWRSRLLFTAVA